MDRDPFRRMREQMEDAFRDLEQEFPGRSGTVPVDIEETGDTVVVRADLPGVETDNIHVEATEDALEIRATEEREIAHEEKEFYRRERSARSFRRTLSLPARVDPDTAEAEYENGVLTVTLQKTEESSGREIDVS